MTQQDLTELIKRVSDKLEMIDIHVWDTSVFVYDTAGTVYTDYDQLKKDISTGSVSAFIEVDAMLGEKVWEYI